MQGSWSPIYENHAIDNMAVVVAFSQPIPDLAFKKALRQAEEAAFANGLRSRNVVPQMQLLIGPAAPGQATPQSNAGLIFNSMAPAERDDGAPTVTRISEQLKLEQGAFMYRTWDYVSWRHEWKRISTLLEPALGVLEGVVSWASIRMEYLDRFRLDADPLPGNLQSLLRQGSRWLAPHIFEQNEEWQNNTACFLPQEDDTRRLLQIFISTGDQPHSASNSANARWLNIVSARQNIFSSAGDNEFNSNMLQEQLDKLHMELKTALSEVITDAFAEKSTCLRV